MTEQPGATPRFRIEHDSMGDVEVPYDAKYRAQTQRAVENFPVSGQRIERAHIEALGAPVHPNDHVNASQSSNDVFPSAIHIAATRAIVRTLVPALQHLEASLQRKAEEFAEVVKSGRTHLMDATPVTLGQEFGGYAATIRYGVERLEASLPRIGELPLGGTAVGTGINTPPGFAAAIIETLAAELDLPLSEARDHFEAQSSRDALVELSWAAGTV